MRKLKIKKVDDKPMVIHTKQKAKIHTHEPKQASIKGSNIYTVDRDPTKKKGAEGSHRKSTVHKVSKDGKLAMLRNSMKNTNQSRTGAFSVGSSDSGSGNRGNYLQFTVCHILAAS